MKPGKLYGAIECGGTKFNCALMDGPDAILAERRIPTTAPNETLAGVVEFFREARAEHGDIAAFGVGAFGPVDIHPESASCGRILDTPKPGWAGTDIRAPLVSAFGLPVCLDTDVNAAALGEWKHGAGRGLSTFVYLTIGTGIGGGVVADGRILHGLVHPELGHILLSRAANDSYRGRCPFHPDCFEGLASGPAMNERWDCPAEDLPSNHPAWELETDYIAQALVSYVCCFSPERFIIGGGVSAQANLFPLVRKKFLARLNGYVKHDKIQAGLDGYIVPPGLGPRSGIVGAYELARTSIA
jgi:fructokinase